VKKKILLERGFSLNERPLHFSISERNYIALIPAYRKEMSIFSKNEKLFTGIRLDAPLTEGDKGDLLFRSNVLYVANTQKGRVEVIHFFDPSVRQSLQIDSPTSLAIDKAGNLFIASQKGIAYLHAGGTENLFTLKNKGIEISIHNGSFFILDPLARTIDVYSIVYTDPRTDTQ
jgi:hypothetical protein